MKLRKGDNVEVMNKKEVPFTWCPARILSGNYHSYRVRFYGNCGVPSRKIETVSRKFVRPCPPPVQGAESWIVGEIVEVFYEYTWKVATILKVLEPDVKSRKVPALDATGRNKCLVRLDGCSWKVIVEGSNIRMRQTWHDGKWILIVMSTQESEAVSSLPSSPNFYDKTSFQIPQCVARVEQQSQINGKYIQGEAASWESQMVSSRKRTSPYGSFVIEACNGHIQKLRAMEKDGRKQRVVAAPVLGKVKNDVYYPRKTSGEQSVHGSFKIMPTGYNCVEREEPCNALGNYSVGNSKNSSDSDSCSVGSCSVGDPGMNNVYVPFTPLPQQQTDATSSDAESCNCSGSERKSSYLLPREDVEISIRWLELYAYRRTLKALYASGPLSWEQEALLTNLRIMLHISNDEHLMELKHLISGRTSTKNR